MNSGNERPSALEDTRQECKTLACAIQTCLKRRDFDEKRCKKVIAKWKECFERLNALEAGEQKE